MTPTDRTLAAALETLRRENPEYRPASAHELGSGVVLLRDSSAKGRHDIFFDLSMWDFSDRDEWESLRDTNAGLGRISPESITAAISGPSEGLEVAQRHIDTSSSQAQWLPEPRELQLE